jgi:hypothetical protein
MSESWKDWNRNEIIFGIVVPLLVVLAILGIFQLDRLIRGEINIITCASIQFGEQLVLVTIPLFLGLVWNRWVGGASGFIMGAFYGLLWTESYFLPFDTPTVGARIILLGYVLSPMLIGYMAGVLNGKSKNFKRMLIVGLLTTTIGGILLFGIFHLSPANVTTGLEGFALVVISRIINGAITPIAGKLFFRWTIKK